MLLCVFLLFLLLYGRLTLQAVIIALLVAFGVFAFSVKILGHSLRRELLAYRLLPWALGYLFLLLWEILKAALGVMGLVFSKHKPEEGYLVPFSSGLRSAAAKRLLANSITLTPGTITVRLEEENDRFLVHCLTAELANEVQNEASAFLPMLRRLDSIIEGAEKK